MVQPNIDRQGRVARAITGSLCIAFGVGLWFVSWPDALTWRWVLTIAAVLAGGFQLFEAKRGWCVARACGFRTPM